MAAFDQLPVEKRVELVVRGVYEDSGGGPGGTRVVPGSVREVKIGEPEGGWTALADIESPDGRDTLRVTYDGNQYTDIVEGAGAEEGDRTDAEPLLPPGRGLTPDEVQRIVRDLDTQEEIDAFLATVELAEDDETAIVAALLESQPSEEALRQALIALTVSGAILLALALGGSYEVLRFTVPEGWAEVPYLERMGRAQQAIAAAERRTITPDDLAGYRNRLDENYRQVTRGHGQALVDGDIEVGEYHRRMVDTIVEAHTVQRRLGQGRLSPQDERDLQDTLEEQLGYLGEFVGQIEAGTLTPAQILDRSGRYGANGGLSFNAGMAAALTSIAVSEQRFLGSCSPHCAECVDYAARGMVPVGSLPAPRVACRCRDRCCCRQEFYDLLGQRLGWIG